MGDEMHGDGSRAGGSAVDDDVVWVAAELGVVVKGDHDRRLGVKDSPKRCAS
jgi:hypothetical protein